MSLASVEWVGEAGLVLDVVGALVLLSGLVVGPKRAIELGVMYLAGETDEENLQLPPVRDRLIQSRNAKVGLVFLVLGFVGQAIGNWPS